MAYFTLIKVDLRLYLDNCISQFIFFEAGSSFHKKLPLNVVQSILYTIIFQSLLWPL